MIFSSPGFIFVFLPATLAVFFLVPARFRTVRKLWLCLASLFFYGYWKAEYVPLLLVSILFNFTIAELLMKRRGQPSARLTLGAGVGFNLLLLGYFKYADFIATSLGLLVRQNFGGFDIILPLAISFFTFTQIAYLVDVYRDPKLHYPFLDYALFVVFFPHLIAGPIVRHWEIIPQFAERDLRVNRVDLGVGLTLFLMGLYKKLFLADSIAVYADEFYGAAAQGGAIFFVEAWLGTTAYALQIYFDFSGYSDMAIGLARMFSIKFPVNFDSPYKAGNMPEFWRRWHMTLMRFLREYVYFPLGGSRSGTRRQIINILITFLLSGLWHGAGWTFIIWGLFHGVCVAIAHQWRNFVTWRRWQLSHWSYRGACVMVTFAAVVLSWSYFRAPNLETANRVASTMVGVHGFTVPDAIEGTSKKGKLFSALGAKFIPGKAAMREHKRAALWIASFLGIAWFFPNTQQLLGLYEPVTERQIRPSRWRLPINATLGLVLGVLLFLVIHVQSIAVPSPFLYFNF